METFTEFFENTGELQGLLRNILVLIQTEGGLYAYMVQEAGLSSSRCRTLRFGYLLLFVTEDFTLKDRRKQGKHMAQKQ